MTLQAWSTRPGRGIRTAARANRNLGGFGSAGFVQSLSKGDDLPHAFEKVRCPVSLDWNFAEHEVRPGWQVVAQLQVSTRGDHPKADRRPFDTRVELEARAGIDPDLNVLRGGS